MTRRDVLVAALLTMLLVGLAAWFMEATEWVDIDVPVFARGEAARDRFYVAKQLARQLGAEVTTVHSLERLPPAGATLVLGSRRWSMFPGREAALRRWVDAGGHLVAMQSAWSEEGDTPRWVPMRSARPARHARAAASGVASAASADRAASANDEDQAGAAEAAAAESLRAARTRLSGHCDEFAEPAGTDGAFGAPRHFRVCGFASRILHARAPRWLLVGADGAVAARVAYGGGDITVDALEGSLANGSLVRDDGALAFAAMLQLRSGDRVWFFDEETRPRFLAVLWQHGAAALLLGLAATLLLLWRGGVRFGPLLADPPRARRSIGEQVRRTAAFIAAGGGAALHRASVRALEDEARRSLAGYAGLVGLRERSEAIAQRSDGDAAALAAAMSGPPPRPDLHSLATAIARLERARRALRPPRRRQQPLHSSDASPP